VLFSLELFEGSCRVNSIDLVISFVLKSPRLSIASIQMIVKRRTASARRDSVEREQQITPIVRPLCFRLIFFLADASPSGVPVSCCYRWTINRSRLFGQFVNIVILYSPQICHLLREINIWIVHCEWSMSNMVFSSLSLSLSLFMRRNIRTLSRGNNLRLGGKKGKRLRVPIRYLSLFFRVINRWRTVPFLEQR